MRSTKLQQVRHFFSGSNNDGRSKPPRLLWLRSSTAFILSTVCLAIFTDILFYGLIVPVIPFSLTVQVGIPPDEVQQWTAILLACYSVTLFVGSPIVGIYADRTASRRAPLLIGLLALAASTLLLCLARTIALLVVGRLLQGLSAAIVWSVGLALLADTMGSKIGYAMGWVSIAMSVGLLISPVIGGAIYAAAGYYAVYYVAFGVIFCDIVLRLLLVEKKVAKQWIKHDNLAAADTSDGRAAVVRPEHASLEARTASRTELSPGLVDSQNTASEEKPALPGQNEASHASPQPPLTMPEPSRVSKTRYPQMELIKSKRMLAALWGCVVEAGVMFAFDTIVPLFVKNTFDWTSTAAGLIFICAMVPGFCSPLVGSLADRFGAKWPSLAGFVTSIPLLVCLRLVTQNTVAHKVLLGALLAMLGLSLTFSNTPLMAEVTYAIEAKEAKHPGIWGEKGVYGIGYGLFTTAFALGGTVGSIMSGYLVAGPGWGTATWVLAIWCASGAVVVALWVGGKPPKLNVRLDFNAVEAEQERA